MASFKVKLVLYFLLLSLLPVAAAFWGFSTVASHGETRRDDALILLDGKRIIASSPPVFGFASLKPGTAQVVTIGGARYRALGAGSLDEFRATRLAVISPQGAIDAAAAKTRERLLVFMLAVLVLVAIVAYFEGRSIVRNLAGLVEAARGIARGSLNERVPVRGRDEFAQLGHAFNEMADQLQARLAELESERQRLREAFARFADALGATHDPDQLLRVVLDTAVQATGAAGAAIVGDARAQLLHVGEIEGGADRLELPLSAGRSSFRTLVLVGESFDEEARLTATSLAAQAVLPLANARP